MECANVHIRGWIETTSDFEFACSFDQFLYPARRFADRYHYHQTPSLEAGEGLTSREGHTSLTCRTCKSTDNPIQRIVSVGIG